jgi:ABC-2 type transport system ATP-binding protein
MNAAVQLENVCKCFGRITAVKNLNLSVPSASVYGFIGPNGAGKTTTIRMIMDIIRPDTGLITVLNSNSINQARKCIGYMPEERGLYRKMTVSDVLSYFAAIKGVNRSKIKQSVSNWLEQVELTQSAGKRVEELSRGMHQKLQFAVTVINDPDLLILDEPFSGLDPLNTDLLKTIIRQMKSLGKTIILSTHAMHEAEQLCDCIVLINKGQVLPEGTISEIKKAHMSHAVKMEIEAGEDLPKEINGVENIRQEGNCFYLTLQSDTKTQYVLQYLAQSVHIHEFKVCVPSLHEIFVNQVSKTNAADS